MDDLREQVAATLMMYFPSPSVVPSRSLTLGTKDALMLADQIIPLVRRAVAQEIFKETESHKEDVSKQQAGEWFMIIYSKDKWQALKARMGVKDD